MWLSSLRLSRTPISQRGRAQHRPVHTAAGATEIFCFSAGQIPPRLRTIDRAGRTPAPPGQLLGGAPNTACSVTRILANAWRIFRA